jgi:hypothetical protein
MAKVPDLGATMFLSPMDAPGIVVERIMDTLDHGLCSVGSTPRLPRSMRHGQLAERRAAVPAGESQQALEDRGGDERWAYAEGRLADRDLRPARQPFRRRFHR